MLAVVTWSRHSGASFFAVGNVPSANSQKPKSKNLNDKLNRESEQA